MRTFIQATVIISTLFTVLIFSGPFFVRDGNDTMIELIFYLVILATFFSLFVISAMRWVAHSRANAIDKNPEEAKHYKYIVVASITLILLALFVSLLVYYIPGHTLYWLLLLLFSLFVHPESLLVIIFLIILVAVVIMKIMRKK